MPHFLNKDPSNATIITSVNVNARDLFDYKKMSNAIANTKCHVSLIKTRPTQQ